MIHTHPVDLDLISSKTKSLAGLSFALSAVPRFPGSDNVKPSSNHIKYQLWFRVATENQVTAHIILGAYGPS